MRASSVEILSVLRFFFGPSVPRINLSSALANAAGPLRSADAGTASIMSRGAMSISAVGRVRVARRMAAIRRKSPRSPDNGQGSENV